VSRVLYRDPQRFAADELAPRFEVAFTDELGASIITRRHGRGTIVYLASSRFLSSGSLGSEDNMILAANLAQAVTRHGRGARFAFDEWHQVPRATGGAAGLGLLARGLFTNPVGWTLLVLTGALALWMLREATQFGTRMPVAPPQRRSKLEYVIGVGGTWRARGARQLALELLLRNARHAFAARAHVGPATSISALAERLRQRTGTPLRGLEVTLESCQAALERPTLGAPEFRRLTAALTNLEAELVSASAKALARKRHSAETTL
jgi:hypothetical protein